MTDERGRRVWILPSFPTPNGDMHVGHLAGPFIAADVLRRSRLISGDDPRLLLGTVGHQSQVATAAREAGRCFYAEAEANTASIRATLTSLLVEPSVFVEPRDARYPGISLEVFQRLVDSGYVVAAQVPTHFCDRCSAFRFESFLGGSCPHCGSGQTAGIECEQCALPYSEHELVGAFCAICEEPTSLIEVERWVLRLESLRTQLILHHDRSRTTDTLARHLRRVLASPLPDFPASIIGTDGVSVPAPVAEVRQVLYSGFELVGRYLTAVDLVAQEEDRDWLEELRANDAADMVVLFGFDNAYLRGVVFTAMIIALEIEGLNVPTAYLTNEFYELEGQKFSTSRNHAIWGRDPRITARPDEVRLHVSLTRPDIERMSFSPQDFDAKATQFNHVVSTWLARAKVVDSEQNGGLGVCQLLSVSQLLSDFRTVIEVATRRIARYADVPTFNPRLLALEGVRVVHEGAEFARRGYPHHRRAVGMAAALQLEAIQLAERALAPIMPGLTATIRDSGVLDVLRERAIGWKAAHEDCTLGFNFGDFEVRRLDLQDDVAGLFLALDDEQVWEHIPSGRPRDVGAYWQRLTKREEDPDTLQFLIVERSQARPLGITSLFRLDSSSVEIGSTTICPAYWGTGLNASVKHGLLNLVRERIGATDVLLRTDERNTRSQRAIAKLGAVHVETRHQDIERIDGSLRDTFVYRIRLDSENNRIGESM